MKEIPITVDGREIGGEYFYEYFQKKLGELPLGEALLVMELLGMNLVVNDPEDEEE